jgi:hypothetical protein
MKQVNLSRFLVGIFSPRIEHIKIWNTVLIGLQVIDLSYFDDYRHEM